MAVIEPLTKRLVVEPLIKKGEKIGSWNVTKTKGGILLPDEENKKAPTRGRVLAIAEDSELKKAGKVKPGDIILFSKYSGADIVVPAKAPGEEERLVLIMKDEDILAVIRESDKNKK